MCCLEGEALGQLETLRLKRNKDFARAKFNEGLIVYAGTINPYAPRQLIRSSSIPSWIEHAKEQETADPDRVQEQKK